MSQNRFHKFISFALLAAYLNLIAITVFHFHVNSGNKNPVFELNHYAGTKTFDPFSDGNSNCAVTLFSSELYFIEKISEESLKSYPARELISEYQSQRLFSFLINSNSLRAPPVA